MTDQHRGHTIVQQEDESWIYADTGQGVSKNPNRQCGHCDLPNRKDGHDACLGVLPGVMNACCGHGDVLTSYVQCWPNLAERKLEDE